MVRILPLDPVCDFRIRKHAVSIASLTPRPAWHFHHMQRGHVCVARSSRFFLHCLSRQDSRFRRQQWKRPIQAFMSSSSSRNSKRLMTKSLQKTPTRFTIDRVVQAVPGFVAFNAKPSTAAESPFTVVVAICRKLAMPPYEAATKSAVAAGWIAAGRFNRSASHSA